MKIWHVIQAEAAVVGGWLGWFLGGIDGLVYALTAFVVIDYISGVMVAATQKKLSSDIGFIGILRKVIIFMMVGVANVVDVQIIGSGCVLRNAVIFFYLSNEGISLLENAAKMGLPVPEKLKAVLAQLQTKKEDKE